MVKILNKKDIAIKIVKGVIVGVLYYIAFVYLIPYAITFYIPEVQILQSVRTTYVSIFLALFIGIGIARSILRESVLYIPLSLFSAVLAVFVMVHILNYGIIDTSIELGGYVLNIKVDMKSLIYVIAMGTIAFAFISAIITYIEDQQRKNLFNVNLYSTD